MHRELREEGCRPDDTEAVVKAMSEITHVSVEGFDIPSPSGWILAGVIRFQKPET